MQFKVPQNIDLEDKIVGPLTLIQFVYVLGGGVIIYLLYLSLHMRFLFWILAAPIGLIALALAFLKIQDQPLSHFLKAGLVYLSRPKKRLWQRTGLVKPVVFAVAKKEKAAPALSKRRIEKSELEKLAQTLDTRGIQKS
jgi:hypothetical protein